MSIRVMQRVWEASKSTHAARLVLLAIADFADDGGGAWPSTGAICKKTLLSDRSVQGAIKELVALGELEVKPNAAKGGCNYFIIKITPEKSSPPKDLPPEKPTPPKSLRPPPEKSSDEPSGKPSEQTPPNPPTPADAPPAGEGGGKGEKSEAEKAESERRRGLGARAAKIIHRSGRHQWTDPEKTAIRKWYPDPNFEASMPIVEMFYALPEEAFIRRGERRADDYRRTSLITLLRHWWTEAERAERFFEKHPHWKRKMQAKLHPEEPPPRRPAPPSPEVEFTGTDLPPAEKPFDAPPLADFDRWKASLTPPEPELIWDGLDKQRQIACQMWLFRNPARGTTSKATNQ